MADQVASLPLSPKVGDRPTPLRIRLDAETAEALRQLCEREGCKPSEAVRRAIRARATGDRALLLEILAAVRAQPAADSPTGPAVAAPEPEPESPAGPLAGILSWSARIDEED